MTDNSINKIIAKTFTDIADALETGHMVSREKIALTGLGSEHGESVTMEGALLAAKRGVEVTYIGLAENEAVKTVKAADDNEAHLKMNELIASGEIDAAVTMHYPFPIGVSTVGKVITPGRGKELYIATTTGSSSADRIEAMILNAVYGIITAKACGLTNPTVGILNIDGANKAYLALKELSVNGYDINFANTTRSDGGPIMRGNDVLSGACDVLVADSLTGNILVKMLSAFSTGGSYEAVGCGYGPGIGKNQKELVLIVSRASGAPVIAGALEFAADLVKGNVAKVSANEFALAEKAGLNDIIKKYKQVKAAPVEAKAPKKEVVTAEIQGIDVMDLEDAVFALWAKGIYAESGMGCTGPIILVNPSKEQQAVEILKAGNWVS